jgi:hypothetical protein
MNIIGLIGTLYPADGRVPTLFSHGYSKSSKFSTVIERPGNTKHRL